MLIPSQDTVATDGPLAERLCYELQQRFLGTGHRVRYETVLVECVEPHALQRVLGSVGLCWTVARLTCCRQAGPAGRQGLGEVVPGRTQALVHVHAADLGSIDGACES